MINIRSYNPNTDYPAVERLYKDSSTFGGQFDEARDSEEKLRSLIESKPNSILIAENNGKIVGTVTLFEDERSAWLYRFAIEKENEEEIASKLKMRAFELLKEFGHSQVLVYAPAGDVRFSERYTKLGFTQGGDFTAFWENIN